MILVLLGTFPLQFDRPLKEIDLLLQKGLINEEVIVQNGHTAFQSNHMVFRPFLDLNELLKLYDQADLIISQAGTGSIIKGLKKNKKIIAIPRLSKYGEVVDDHQVELVNEFAEGGYLLPWLEGEALEKILAQAKTFEPKPFHSNNGEMMKFLIQYIDGL